MVFAKSCIVAATNYQSWWPKSNANVLYYNFRHQKSKSGLTGLKLSFQISGEDPFSPPAKPAGGKSPFLWRNHVWVWLLSASSPLQCAHPESPGSSDSKVSRSELQIPSAVLTLSKLSIIIFLGKRRWASSREDDLRYLGTWPYLTCHSWFRCVQQRTQ